MPWDGSWEGGPVWVSRTEVDPRTKQPLRTYHIRKMYRGTLYMVSTRCHDVKSARTHLARFLENPEAYTPEGALPGDPVPMTEDLIDSYYAWCLKETPSKKKNSPGWARQKRRYLRAFAKKLGAKKDLRKLDLDQDIFRVIGTDEEPAVRGRPHYIEALKHFYAYLREVRRSIKPHEDPTLNRLTVPQGKPNPFTQSKVIPWDHHLAVLKVLDEVNAARLIVLAATGWHVTELDRFARDGSIDGSVLTCPLHKGGDPHRTQVNEVVLEAARKVRAAGGFGSTPFYRKLRKACVKAEVKPFTPGRYRHTVIDYAMRQGMDPGLVSRFVGHKSRQTTEAFYARWAVPVKVATPV